MNLKRCNNGHFYDEDKYSTCPHCSGGGETNHGVTVGSTPNKDTTIPLNFSPGENTTSISETSQADDDQNTISYSSNKIGYEPTVGWLVVVKGEDFGIDFRLKSGRNFIGRSSSMDISLKSDKTVSREKHAIVVFDPKSSTYIVQPGTSKELCYLNDEVVLSPQVLKLDDIIIVGETSLLFVPLCRKDGFNWDKAEDK